MKLKNKALCLLLLMGLSMPTFATVRVEDTFSVENIKHTLVYNGGTYIISSDNTVRANGTAIRGASEEALNTGTNWVHLLDSKTNLPLNNVVGLSFVYDLYLWDTSGSVYIVESSKLARKLDTGNLKFNAVTSIFHRLYSINTPSTIAFMLEDKGSIYTHTVGENSVVKLDGIEGVKKIINTTVYSDINAQNHSNYVVALKEDGTLYTIDVNKNIRKLENISNVKDIYLGQKTFYALLSSGKLFEITNEGTSKQVVIPDGTSFVHMYGDKEGNIGVNLSNGSYRLSGTTLVSNSERDSKDNHYIYPMVVAGSRILDATGKYYSFQIVTNAGGRFLYSDLAGVSSWVNGEAIVPNSETGRFKIDIDTIYKRSDSLDIIFDLVTKKTPRAFNIYYAKSEDIPYKAKWTTIENNVDAIYLNPKPYSRNFTGASNTQLDGLEYTYNWKIGNADLLGVHLIVEPIYDQN